MRAPRAIRDETCAPVHPEWVDRGSLQRARGVRGVLAVPSGHEPLLRAQTCRPAVRTAPEPSARAGRAPSTGSPPGGYVFGCPDDPKRRHLSTCGLVRPDEGRCRSLPGLSLPSALRQENWPETEGSIAYRGRLGSSTPSLFEAVPTTPQVCAAKTETRRAPEGLAAALPVCRLQLSFRPARNAQHRAPSTWTHGMARTVKGVRGVREPQGEQSRVFFREPW
jgi:hypothetical protein